MAIYREISQSFPQGQERLAGGSADHRREGPSDPDADHRRPLRLIWGHRGSPLLNNRTSTENTFLWCKLTVCF